MARWSEWESAGDDAALGEAKTKVREAMDAVYAQVAAETTP